MNPMNDPAASGQSSAGSSTERPVTHSLNHFLSLNFLSSIAPAWTSEPIYLHLSVFLNIFCKNK
jgi:hypothetical protein